MRKKIIRDISASSFQMIINHLAGLIVFYIISNYLDKNSFGEINWTLAVLLTAFNILSFGIDNVSIRKIASGAGAQSLLATYIWHVLFSGIFLYGLLFISLFLFPSFFQKHNLILFLGLSRLMIFFSTPFKQLAAGMEKFRILMWMSISSNLMRSAGILVLAFLNKVTIPTIITLFILSAIAELIVCLFLTYNKLNRLKVLRWNRQKHISLIKESLPQFGVVIFDSAIARFDWIFLGLFASTIILADYSFAYKVFEVSTLPLLIIAPLLIPRLTKLFQKQVLQNNDAKIKHLFTLLRIEIIIACFIALLLNMAWVPVIDYITNGKYGTVNVYTILILSVSMPFLYINNFLWSVNFARGYLKMIFFIFSITFLINLTGNILLIPFFSAEGAAFAYTFAVIMQTILYVRKTKLKGLGLWPPLVICSLSALFGGYFAMHFFNDTWQIFLVSISLYLIMLVITRQIRMNDWVKFKEIIG